MVTQVNIPAQIQFEDYQLYKQELEEILILNGISDKEKETNIFIKIINQVYETFPKLAENFNEALKKTLEMALSRIVIDNSVVVSPLMLFANKYSNDDLLEICNQLSLWLFDIQQKGFNNINQQQDIAKVEF